MVHKPLRPHDVLFPVVAERIPIDFLAAGVAVSVVALLVFLLLNMFFSASWLVRLPLLGST